MEYFFNGISFALGTAIGLFVVVFMVVIKDKIENNKRYGRKWWKI